MSRKLTDEERELWDRLRQSVRPLAKALPQPAEPAENETPKPPANARKKTARAKPQPARSPPPPAKPVPALAPLEQRTRRRLSRGLVEIDARIDLHGMRQERAFHALVGFLRRAQMHDHRIVLVVTGKGSGDGEGRGVLNRTVPDWLSRPDLRSFVVGWEPAGRRHGGAGALYVRIRRRREARRLPPPGS
jgi:DNA-nicking Smr family endonuclease